MSQWIQAKDQVEVNKQFNRLATLLAVTPLPSSEGIRHAEADEFMLMEIKETSWDARFKHRDTRNYVSVVRSGSLRLPQLVWRSGDLFDHADYPDGEGVSVVEDPERFNVFIKMVDGDEFYHVPIMQDRRNKRDYHAGSLSERYPTVYTKRTVGAAVAFGLGIRRDVQVRPALVEGDNL